MQKYAILVDLVKSFPTSICLQKSASTQPGTSLSKLGGDSDGPAPRGGPGARAPLGGGGWRGAGWGGRRSADAPHKAMRLVWNYVDSQVRADFDSQRCTPFRTNFWQSLDCKIALRGNRSRSSHIGNFCDTAGARCFHRFTDRAPRGSADGDVIAVGKKKK